MAKRGSKPVHIPALQKNKTQLPSDIALVKNPSDVELSPYHISFEFYNYKECGVGALERNKAIQCLEDLKIIGQSNRKNLIYNGIDYIKVGNGGEYSKLFSKLTDDVELKEHKLPGTARIFYFTQQNKFFIVAITNSHYETDKHR